MQTLDEFVCTLPETTDGISEISRDELSIIVDEAFRDNTGGVVTYAFTETADKTLLCSVLSENDGLSSGEIASIVSSGLSAQSDANNRFSDNENLHNAYRHFTWNVRGVKNGKTNAARIFTINYEWAAVYLGQWNERYAQRYDYWYDVYEETIATSSDPASIIALVTRYAQADADDYICNLKTLAQTSLRNNFNLFDQSFPLDSMRDWYNDYAGRNYAAAYPSASIYDIYTYAYNSNVLYITEDQLQYTNRYRLWEYTAYWCTN